MDTEVVIQDAYSYATWPMYVMLGIIAVILLLVVVATIVKKLLSKRKKKAPKVVKPEPVNLVKLKSKCLSELNDISVALVNERIDVREAYQKTSVCVRQFVFGATRINVQNYTLEEIKEVKMPQLEALISEYYSPEFAWKSSGDFADSMEKTKRVVEQWK